MTCIGEPVSWLRLEQFALDSRDAAVRDHVAACPACRRCLDDIRGDAVALPALPAIAAAPRRAWWRWAVPAIATALAAAIVLAVLRPKPRDEVATVKGVGEVVLDVVRERGGAVRDDVRSFLPGDRWKVVVTCPPEAGAWIDVGVVEAGTPGVDYPIAPAHVACGNRVVVPGAFAITGYKTNRVCVRVAADAAPARDGAMHPGDEGVACVTLQPERL
ncbi:MAG TPA: hypothetical protein VLX92_29990 [Kofleriaceae bacterium]|nr:hypothetical protein [Kofleriaceae bacterium]